MYYHRLLQPAIKQSLDSKQALIITGMRRTGKTTLLKHIFNQLESDNKVWFDLENPLDIKYFEDTDYNDVYENILNKGSLKRGERVYVFVDEVQYYPGISKIAKYLIDHYGVKFVLTGSAQYYLKNLFPESLAGRKKIFELYPLSFREFLGFREKDIALWQKLSQKNKLSEVEYEYFDKDYEEYIQWGGFPEAVLADTQEEKHSILDDIFSSYYQNEILHLGDFRKNKKVRDLILLLGARVGSQLDLVKLSQELGITRATVYSYLEFLQATYFIHLVSPFSGSVDRRVSGTQKVYFCDNGILRLMEQASSGQFLENAVYNQLKFLGKLAYYRKRTGAELDFVLDKKTGYEVKRTANQVDVKRVRNMQSKIKLKDALVISQQYVKEQEGVVFGQFV